MKTVQLGRTGEQISQLALGCMIMGTVTPEDEAFTILDRYVEAGGNFLDTADCYCWWERLREAIDGSLRRLGTDHVDLYYVHVDDRTTPLEETLEALAGIVQAGKARYIGWSNVRTWRLERIRRLCAEHGRPAPVALQQQHTYLRRRAGLRHVSIVDDEQLDYLQAHDDLTLVAYSPILKGIYDDPDKRKGHRAMDPYQGPDAEARLDTAGA